MKSGSHNYVFVVVLILIFKISASASQENRNALNYDPTVLLQTLFNQGGQNNSHILAQLNNALRSFFGNNSNFNERMINILKQNVTNGTQEKNMKNVLSSFSSVKDGLNSAGLPDIGTIATVIDAYLQNSLQSVGVQQSCYNDLKKMASEASSGTDWALRMLDAFGKPGSNLKNFQTKWLGSYDECVAVKAGEYRLVGHEPKLVSEYFAGKYCYLSIPIKKGILPIQPKLMFGACLPSTCSSADINTLLNAATAVIPEDWKSKDPGEAHCAEKRSLDAKAVVAICILSIIGILMMLGTLYDIIAIQMKKSPAQKEQDVKPPPYQSGISNGGYVIELEGSKVALETEAANADTKAVTGNGSAHAEENYNKTLEPAAEVKAEDVRVNVIGPAKTESLGIIEKALLSFSVYTNGVKILSTHQASGSLGAVNGIRFLSMAWVILGHSYFFAIGYDENIFMFFGEQLQEWSFFGILYASVSVDTFFALSGLLVAYLTLKELKKVGGIRHFNWFLFYFHRFWRLTPVYMLVIMVFTCLMKYWGSGPMWPTDNLPYDNCEYSWWTNLLYVNNLVRIEKTCIGWTWYLANDMQFYILSPLILIPLFYQIIVGGVVSLLFLTATITTTAVIVAQHHYPVQQGQYAPKPDDGDYGKLVYIPPWARMGPYIIGLFTGYLLYRMKCKCRMPKACVLLGWIICLFICTSVIYSPYSDKDSHIFSNSDSAAYHALSRTGWGIAVCWIVFACATGYGGWINELLSWKAFIPLGRLTYCAYLLHPIVMLNYNMSRRNLVFFNNYEVIYMFLAHLVMSYGVAFVVSLAFESPMMGLEKALLKRDRRS